MSGVVLLKVPDASPEDTEANRVFAQTWKRKHRRDFLHNLAGFLAAKNAGGIQDMDPDVLLWLLQFAVRNRNLIEAVAQIAVKFKHNIPRMSVDDMRTAVYEARIRSIMEE